MAAFEVHRSFWAFLSGLLGSVLFLAAWVLEWFVGFGAGFLVSWGLSAFVFLFVLPVGVLMASILFNRDPVIAVRGESLLIASAALYGRKAMLAFYDIVGIEIDWIPGTSRARIVFLVTPECFAREARSGPWARRKNGRLSFDVLNTDSTPREIAANLCELLGRRADS